MISYDISTKESDSRYNKLSSEYRIILGCRGENFLEHQK